MFPATTQLLQRLSHRYQEGRKWFDALRRWYKDAKLTRNVIEELLGGEDLHLLRLQLNRRDEPADVTREVDGRRILLRIPAEHLQPGENTLSVGLSGDAERSLELDGVLLGQPRTQLRQKIDLSTPTPEQTPAFRLIGRDRAEPRAGRWELQSNGYLAFRFHLHAVGSVIVALEMPRTAYFPQARSRGVRQEKLLKDVGKRVEKLLKKWIDETAERRHEDGALDDLLAYRELHARQIRYAIENGVSLQDAIDRTGNPDALLAAHSEPVLLEVEEIELPDIPEASTVRAVPKAVRPVAARVDPPKAVPPKAVAAKAAGSGFAGKLLLTLTLAGLSSGAYAAWKFDGLSWLRQKLTSAPAGPRGDVLTALRESGKDLKWQTEVCQEIPQEKLKALMADFGELLGPQDGQVPANVKVFLAGDRKNPLGEALLGLPVCDNMLVVHDLGETAAAKRHFDKMPEGFQAGLRQWGFQGAVDEIAIPHGDQAVRLTTKIGDIPQHRVVVRCGRFLLLTTGGDTAGSEEQERRLTILAKRLREHFGE